MSSRQRNLGYALFLTSCGSMAAAKKIVTALLKAKAAACVSVVPNLTSTYIWRGEVETSAEVMLLIKSRADKRSAIEKIVMKHHHYSLPEFLQVPIDAGSKAYLQWIEECL